MEQKPMICLILVLILFLLCARNGKTSDIEVLADGAAQETEAGTVGAPENHNTPAGSGESGVNEMKIAQTGWTEAVPAEYTRAADRQGNVVRLDYESEDYVRDGSAVTKTAYVYTPYGYDEKDAVRSQSINMAEEMLSREIFTPDHYVFYQKDGGYHDFNAVQEYLYNALPLFFRDSASGNTQMQGQSFTASTAISDVINDPAFGEYGRLIFPVDTGYFSGETLGDLRLTWYSNIDPDKTVEIANYMKSRAEAGEPIFYDIYTDEEKAAEPDKADTGLFFFKGSPGEKFAVCNAGGGFAYVGAMHDSFPHALELSKMGYNAFALIYRPGWDTAMEDLARAISFIFEHAEELEVDTDCYSLWGGSAGARMAADVGSYGTAYFGGDDLPQAGCVVMQYTGHREWQETDPPTYVCVGTSDGIANWRTMQSRIEAMSAAGIPTEFHAYKGLSHGFGLGTGTVAEGWIDDAVEFWEQQM